MCTTHMELTEFSVSTEVQIQYLKQIFILKERVACAASFPSVSDHPMMNAVYHLKNTQNTLPEEETVALPNSTYILQVTNSAKRCF